MVDRGWSEPEEDHGWNDEWVVPEYDTSIRIGVLEGARWHEVDTVHVAPWMERPWTPTPALVSRRGRIDGPERLLLVYPAPIIART